MKRRSVRARLAFVFIIMPSMAATQAHAACLSPQEQRALVQYALPDVVGQLGDSCSATLPADAYLIRDRAALVTRYEIAAKPVVGGAKTALGKIAGLPPEQMAVFSDDTVRGMIKGGVAAAVTGKIKPKDCTLVSEILQQLAPLPPENIAALIGVALREGGKKDASSPFTLCPVPGA